jgi:hypothetical protein
MLIEELIETEDKQNTFNRLLEVHVQFSGQNEP